MQVLQGPRQVGKTTAVRQVFDSLLGAFLEADLLTL
jgi:predicted AAA+ superfamily ATPase